MRRVGIGLNVGQGPDDIPEELRTAATSLRLAGGRVPTAEALWSTLCGALERWYNELTRGNKEAVIGAFTSRSAFSRGDKVRVETTDEVFEAGYQGLDPEGRLVVSRGAAGPVVLDAVRRLERAS